MDINARWIIGGLICGAFRAHDMRFKPDKAMCVKLRRGDLPWLEVLIWSPMNYVGVLTREDGGPWVPWAYHDSCWSSDGVDRIVSHYADEVTGTFLGGIEIRHIKHELQQELKAVLKARYV